MSQMKRFAMISYTLVNRPGVRYRQGAYAPLTPYALDVRDEVPTAEEIEELIEEENFDPTDRQLGYEV